VREIYTSYLNLMGTSEEQLQRAEQLPALREQCKAHFGYLFTVDAYVDDAAADQVKAVVDRVRGDFDAKYTPLFKQNAEFQRLIGAERDAIKGVISGKQAEIRNYEAVCKTQIDSLYNTCWKKIVRFVLRIFGATLYKAKVDFFRAAISSPVAAITRSIGKARKASDAKIGRFGQASQKILRQMHELALTSDEQRALRGVSGRVFSKTEAQLAFAAKPVDKQRESEAGGNTKAARMQFLRFVETGFRKKMHFRHSAAEGSYRRAFEEQSATSDIKLVYRRMTNEVLSSRIDAARVKGAIAPPPPRPAPKAYVMTPEEQRRWDSECAASNGCWGSVTH
jgi:hypothetical protein